MAQRTKPEYTSLAGAGDKYDISEKTVRRLIAKGDLPAVRVGGQVRIKITDLEKLARPIPTACGAE